MKLCLISDTHNQHDQVKLPGADVLVHAGDLTMSGTLEECRHAVGWLNAQDFDHVIMIAGNHDFAFERPMIKALIDLGRITYLENSGVTINGKLFWGSPVQPWFMDWAFNVQRGPAIKKIWDKIPEDTDVLITHGPPMGVLDQSVPGKGEHLGCDDLSNKLSFNPKIHVFGHIHGSYGRAESEKIKFINASIVNEAYKVSNSPIVVEI